MLCCFYLAFPHVQYRNPVLSPSCNVCGRFLCNVSGSNKEQDPPNINKPPIITKGRVKESVP